VEGESEGRLSSQSESSYTVNDMISTLKRLLRRSCESSEIKLKDCSTINMEDEKLKIHHEALQLI
jgi:hypothetical protein